MLIVNEVTLADFYERYTRQLAFSGYRVLILAVVRAADAPEFYSDVHRYWSSLHDLTGAKIAFAVAGPDAAAQAKRHPHVDGVESPMLAGPPQREDFSEEMYLQMKRYRAQVSPSAQALTAKELSNANTQQISALRDRLGLREEQLPCLHVTLLSPETQSPIAIEFASFSKFSIYTVCKEIVGALQEPLHKIQRLERNAGAELSGLEADIRRINRRMEEASTPPSGKTEPLIAQIRSSIAALPAEQRQAIGELIAFCETNANDYSKKSEAFAAWQALKQVEVGKLFLSDMQRLIDVAFGERFRPRDERAVQSVLAEFREQKNVIARRMDEARERHAAAFGPANIALVDAFEKLRRWSESSAIVDRSWDYFLSYAAPDRELAHRLFQELDRISRVFMDQYSIRGGDNWYDAIPDAQARCAATVPIITANTEAAHFQISEITRAVNLYRQGNHELFPVYSEANVKPPFGLEQIHALSLVEASTASIAHAITSASRRRTSWPVF